jgi:hypothetical protein
LGSKVAGRPESNHPTALGSLDRIAGSMLEEASPAERNAWASWAPVLLRLPGIDHWPQSEKTELIEVVLAKGRGRDSDYLRLFNRHPKLGSALARLIRA